MTRFTLSSLAGLAIAGAVALQLGGAWGMGIAMGYLGGAGMTGLGALLQRYVMQRAPARVLQVQVLAFLAKLLIVAVMTVAFRTSESLAQAADFAAFALTFAATVALLLPIGAMDVARFGRPDSPR